MRGYVDRPARLVGAVADVNFTDLGETTSLTAGLESWTYDVHVTGSLRLKAGVEMGSALFYLAGGFALMHIDFDVVKFIGFAEPNRERTLFGATGCAGVEVAMTDAISVFLEGRYTYFGDQAKPPFALIGGDMEFEYAAVMGGVSFNPGNWLIGDY